MDAATRLGEGISQAESEWLERHLGECATCASVASDYEAQAAELRGLAASDAEPPRDLWARTAAAIERESARTAGTQGRRQRPVRRPPLPIGVLSGLLVVLVVIGVSMLPHGTTPIVGPSGSSAALASDSLVSLPVAPTPFAVAPGDVAWIRRAEGGGYAYFSAQVDEVCPGKSQGACAPLSEDEEQLIGALSAPSTIVRSPKNDQLVVVDNAGSGEAGNVYVVPVPGASAATASPSPSMPTGSLSPSAPPSASPSTAPSGDVVAPTDSAPPTKSAEPTPPPSLPTPTPSEPVRSIEPTVAPSPTGSMTIARDVVLVDDAAGYSADGTWFAFSARPADVVQGPDIYVWKVGTERATAVTSDHRSVFASWAGNLVLGSRAGETAPPDGALPSASPSASAGPTGSAAPATPAGSGAPAGEERAQTFVLDPATGRQAVLETDSYWRPIVDPSGRSVVYWDGTVRRDAAGESWLPARGALVLAPWTRTASLDAVTSALADASAAPIDGRSASVQPIALPSPAAIPVAAPAEPRQVLSEAPVLDWDAHWDPSGTHLAIWIADSSDPTIGHLRLYALGPDGRISHLDRPLTDVPALAGFSIEDGRLAWATPPGQDAQGSRVQVVAWKGDQLGSVETAPGDDPALIIR